MNDKNKIAINIIKELESNGYRIKRLEIDYEFTFKKNLEIVVKALDIEEDKREKND